MERNCKKILVGIHIIWGIMLWGQTPPPIYGGVLGGTETDVGKVKNDGVGVNTHQPTETLDINGTLRVRNLPDGSKVSDYPYTVVARETGETARIERPQGWQLYDLDVNGRINKDVKMSETARTKGDLIKAEKAWEVKDSEVYVSIAKEGSVITQVQWTTWFAWNQLKSKLLQGSFRFYAKIQEVNKDNNNLVGSAAIFSDTIGMASYYQSESEGLDEYRISVTVSFTDKGSLLKRNTRYRIVLLCGTEYDANLSEIPNTSIKYLPITNWGVSARGESYYKL